MITIIIAIIITLLFFIYHFTSNFCPKCGKVVDKSDEFCKYCGYELTNIVTGSLICLAILIPIILVVKILFKILLT